MDAYVHSHDLLEQKGSIAGDMVEIKDAPGLSPEQFLQLRLPIQQGSGAEIPSIQVEEIEGDEDALAADCADFAD